MYWIISQIPAMAEMGPVKPEVKNSIQLCHMGGKNPTTQAVAALKVCIRRKLELGARSVC